MKVSSRSIIGFGSLFLGFGSSLLACSDAGEGSGGTGTTTGTTTSSTTSATTSSATSTTSASTSTTSASSTSSGMPVTCLPASATASYFSIQTNDLCATAVYSAPALNLTPAPFTLVLPTWGRHGGPLTSTVVTGPSAVVHVERWSLSGTMLAKTDSAVTLPNVSAMYFDSQLLDLPFNESVVGNSSDNKLELMSDTTAKGRVDASGVYVYASVPPDANNNSRVLYTGLNGTSGALFGIDFQANGTATGAATPIAQWGNASGPVAVDSAGNALAINVDYMAQTQEMRGFTAANIKPLAGPTNGDVLLDTMGSGTSLAAVAPTPAKPGLGLFQPANSTGTPADVIVVRYTSSGGKLTATPSETILKLATAGTNLTLMTDPQDRVWVGAPSSSGTGTTFVILARP